MIIFLYGPDGYRLQKKIKEIEDHYKKIHKNSINFKKFDLKEKKIEDFLGDFYTNSMFEEKKFIVLKNLFSDEEAKKIFSQKINIFSKSEDIFLICENEEISSNDKLLSILKKNGKTQEFFNLDNSSLSRYLKKEIELNNVKITDTVSCLLISYVGNDLWQLDNEIKKLINYKKGGEITEKDVKDLVKPNIETNIFNTIDQVAIKNKKGALYLLKRHLDQGDSPIFLFSRIMGQFRNLLLIKSLDSSKNSYLSDYNFIGKELEIHPFVVKKTIPQANKFSIGELKKIYHDILEVDLKIKTGKIDPEAALDLFIATV